MKKFFKRFTYFSAFLSCRFLLIRYYSGTIMHPGSGICGNSGMYGNVPLRNEAFRAWPKFSGDDSFPVPSITHAYAESEYSRSTDKWVGEYGELRVELLKFMVEFYYNKTFN